MVSKQKKRSIVFIFIALLFLGIITFSSYHFNYSLRHIGKEIALNNLENESLTNSVVIKSEYDNLTNSLVVLRSIVTENHINDETDIIEHLKLICDNTKFNTVGISDASGQAIDSNGFHVNVENRDYFKQAINGNIVISNVLSSKVISNQDVQVIAVPIMKNKTFTGIVFGILDINIVNDSLENSTDNNIYTIVIDEYGKPITPLKNEDSLLGNETIWMYFQHCEFIESNPNEVKAAMQNNASGYYILKINNQAKMSYYAPLGIGNYYIVSNINLQYLSSLLSQIINNANTMSFTIASAIALLFALIFIVNRKVSKQLKQSYQAKLSSEEVLRIAANHSNLFVFVYDITNKTLTRKTEKNHPLINASTMENVPKSLIEKGYINPESIDQFVNLFNQLNFETSVQAEIKTTIDYIERWYRISLHNVYDQSRVIINTVGSIEDITEIKDQLQRYTIEKQQKEQFKVRAEKDALTGLYNGATAKEKIDQLLSQNPLSHRQHILVLLDLDNFKLINDTFGHHYGDEVIKDIAQILAHKFRQDDIIARMGGDEFCVFLYNTKGFEFVAHLFDELVQQCNITYEHNQCSVTISASFGIAISPKDGNNFSELSKKADVALYEVKRSTKKGYKVYDASN